MPLKKIDPRLTPDLLHALASMGQGEYIVVAGANFPTTTLCKNGVPREIRSDGENTITMIAAILDVMPLDDAPGTPVYFACPFDQDKMRPDAIEKRYQHIPDVDTDRKITDEYEQLNEKDFLEKARGAFAVVHTRDNTRYGSVILKKGVVQKIHDIDVVMSGFDDLLHFE